jgi:hypothetical protein
MAFACIYMLAHQADRSTPKMREKKEQKLDFNYFVISIDYWWTTKRKRKDKN